MDPALIGAIAALLTAAAGVATMVSTKEKGRPWVVGIVTLAIVGLVLLAVTVFGAGGPGGTSSNSAASPTEGSSGEAARKEYQRRVRGVCDEDRTGEAQLQRELEKIKPDLQAGDLSALTSMATVLTNAIIKEDGLVGKFEALDPPSELETIQFQAVAVWKRKVAASRAIRDTVLEAAADPGKLAEALDSFKASDEARLEQEKDVLLRKLGGAGCDPSP